MQGRPPIGTHFFIFYFTGLIRYYGATPCNRVRMRRTADRGTRKMPLACS
jgi:hypothetical protein